MITEMMKRSKRRLEVRGNGEKDQSRWINIRRGFLQGDSYSPVGFCCTEIPIMMMIEEMNGYKMGRPGERDTKCTHSLFIDDLKMYQENHESLKKAN